MPAPGAYKLGAEMRRVRDEADISLRELARRLDVSHSVIVRWEKGERIPSTDSVSAFLALTGVSGTRRDRIVAMAREAVDEPANTVSVGSEGMDDQLGVLLGFEGIATEITDVSPLLFPGLLQSSAYVRAIMGRGIPAGEIDTRAAVRIGRRDIITRRRAPAQYTAMICEAVLHQPVGDREVLADQLRLVLDLAERDNVSVRVIPTSAGFTPAHAGPFLLLEFETAAPVVHLEHYRSSAFLRDQGDVGAYLTARDDLAELVMSPDESVGLIADVIKMKEIETT